MVSPENASVGVVGAGTMGAGICEVAARGGYNVVFIESDERSIAAGWKRLDKSLGRALEKGKISSDELDSIRRRIRGSIDLGEVADCGVLIEAVPEILELKQQVFADLDRFVSMDSVLATNTSSISVAEIAAATRHPERVIGLHFFNPAPIMKLIELVTTLRTSSDALESAQRFVARVGKRAVACRDRAGFIVNYIMSPYLNEAIRMFEHGYASVEAIDEAMKLGAGHPMGPFELLDTIGLDVALAVQESLYEDSKESCWAPVPLLKHMVAAGQLGRKTGRGFYEYPAAADASSQEDRPDGHVSELSA